jgi:hypothetical protein
VAREICGTVDVKLSTVKNKEGKLLEDTTEIKKRWKQPYKELYSSGNPVDRTVLEELPENNSQEQILDIREKEVETAVKNLTHKRSYKI